jgi:hypothetical protein
MKRRRRGKNVTAGVCPRFRAACHPRAPGGRAGKPSPVAVELVQFLSEIFFQISVPSLVIRGQSFGVVPALIRKSLQNLLGRRETCNFQGMNKLLNETSVRAVRLSEKAYESLRTTG